MKGNIFFPLRLGFVHFFLSKTFVFNTLGNSEMYKDRNRDNRVRAHRNRYN